MRSAPAAVGCLLLVLSACGGEREGTAVDGGAPPTVVDSPAPGESGVLLTFDGPDVLAPTVEEASVRVRRLGDAPLTTDRSGDGTRGLLFPAYEPGAREARLVLLLEGTGRPTPGAADGLTFGADVRLDEGATSGAADNGDNVVQRGLYADDDQYKLQVDHRVPSCSVRTPRGRVVLELARPSDAGWWRLRCHYDGVELSGSASRLDGQQESRSSRTAARLGALSFPATTGVSVGGKVSAKGTLVTTQPDQLNGALDNVLVSPAP